MKKEKILTISIIALIISFFIDKYIVEFFKLIQAGFLSGIFGMVNLIGSIFGVFIITTIYIYVTKRKKELYPLWITIFLVAIASYFLKEVIARPRPTELIPSIINLMKFSMPSAHAASVFSVIPFFKKETRKYWIYFALIVAFSRLYSSAHYLSDVIAGGLLGWGIVSLVLYFYKKK